MNTIHPLLVHFPIAFLGLYCVFEFLRFQKLIQTSWWFYIKAILVILGTFTAFIARTTGELSGDNYRGVLKDVIEHHEKWSGIASFIFVIISIAYILYWLNKVRPFTTIAPNTFLGGILLGVLRYASIFIEQGYVIFFAVLGLASLTITGALGASIVYGPDIDPIVHAIYKLIVK